MFEEILDLKSAAAVSGSIGKSLDMGVKDVFALVVKKSSMSANPDKDQKARQKPSELGEKITYSRAPTRRVKSCRSGLSSKPLLMQDIFQMTNCNGHARKSVKYSSDNSPLGQMKQQS